MMRANFTNSTLGQWFRARRPPAAAPADGRLGWFEGVRDDRLCGWTFLPAEPWRSFEVTLEASGGLTRTVRADRFRADLQAAGAGDGYFGFSIPAAWLPGAALGASCLWTDLGVALPGSPWDPSRTRRFRAGALLAAFDRPPAGDPRLSGWVRDRRAPLRRVRLAARVAGEEVSGAVACLYRRGSSRGRGDDFHGFVLALPAPLRLLAGGLDMVDADDGSLLARLGPRSL
jgi:hypothetical protein